MNDPKPAALPARVLFVAESDDAAETIAAAADAPSRGVHITSEPARLLADVTRFKPDVVVLALPSLDDAVPQAMALRANRQAEARDVFILLLCSGAEAGAAARLCGEGVCDDYVAHLPTPVDPARLAAGLRLGCRIALCERPRTAARARPIVLVVEDDTFSHQLIAITLETRGVDLVFEADGGAALQRIGEVRPDLVLMDVMLPGHDGVDLTHSLKSDPALAAIPVVMVTGEARRDVLVRSVEAGAADFIVKPFTPDALVAKLAKYLPLLH